MCEKLERTENNTDGECDATDFDTGILGGQSDGYTDPDCGTNDQTVVDAVNEGMNGSADAYSDWIEGGCFDLENAALDCKAKESVIKKVSEDMAEGMGVDALEDSITGMSDGVGTVLNTTVMGSINSAFSNMSCGQLSNRARRLFYAPTYVEADALHKKAMVSLYYGGLKGTMELMNTDIWDDMVDVICPAVSSFTEIKVAVPDGVARLTGSRSATLGRIGQSSTPATDLEIEIWNASEESTVASKSWYLDKMGDLFYYFSVFGFVVFGYTRVFD